MCRRFLAQCDSESCAAANAGLDRRAGASPLGSAAPVTNCERRRRSQPARSSAQTGVGSACSALRARTTSCARLGSSRPLIAPPSGLRVPTHVPAPVAAGVLGGPWHPDHAEQQLAVVAEVVLGLVVGGAASAAQADACAVRSADVGDDGALEVAGVHALPLLVLAQREVVDGPPHLILKAVNERAARRRRLLEAMESCSRALHAGKRRRRARHSRRTDYQDPGRASPPHRWRRSACAIRRTGVREAATAPRALR